MALPLEGALSGAAVVLGVLSLGAAAVTVAVGGLGAVIVLAWSGAGLA